MLLGWFAIIAQLALMIHNRQASVPETLVRFISFFTILTNLWVAIYFTTKSLKISVKKFPLIYTWGTTTALTAFILVVGITYQVVLRQIWNPTGLQRLVDELLHTVIPLFVLVYWYCYSQSGDYKWRPILHWMVYPIFYFLFVLVRGNVSHFYPYPFINADKLKLSVVLLNAGLLFVFILGIIALLIFIGRKRGKRKFGRSRRK